jgi:DNA-binding NtrC family response regulator
VEEFERRYLSQAVMRTGGNLAQAAKLAGVSRQSLSELAAKYGIVSSRRPKGS